MIINDGGRAGDQSNRPLTGREAAGGFSAPVIQLGAELVSIAGKSQPEGGVDRHRCWLNERLGVVVSI